MVHMKSILHCMPRQTIPESDLFLVKQTNRSNRIGFRVYPYMV